MEHVIFRKIFKGQHYGWIQRLDIAIQNSINHALIKYVGITTGIFSGSRRLGNRMVCAYVFSYEKRINLCRITSYYDILKRIGEYLGLVIKTLAQDFAYGHCLSDIVHCIF